MICTECNGTGLNNDALCPACNGTPDSEERERIAAGVPAVAAELEAEPED